VGACARGQRGGAGISVEAGAPRRPFPPAVRSTFRRLIGKELQDRWGSSVIVENKPGSTIGPEYLVKSAPDGYTLMIISSTPLVTLPHLQKVPYDVLKDLVA